MVLYEKYYIGEHPMPFITRRDRARMIDEFRRMMEVSRTNFMRLVVDAVEERLKVEGFHVGDSDQRDGAAWEIWEANDMSAQFNVAAIESLIKGVSYLSVWEDLDNDGYADIAVEDALECIVAYTPGSNHRHRDAALKIWHDEWTGRDRANLFLPDRVYMYERETKAPDSALVLPWRAAVTATREMDWKPLDEVENRFGVVPIVPLRNRPRVLVEGESELADVYRIQEQINGLTFLLMLAGYMGAHKQRWATGLEIMQDAAGNPVEPFNPSITRIWQAENPETKFGEFSETDLSNYIKAIEQNVLHIAVTTRTPRHYLIEQGQSPSGDAIKSAEAGLTQKVARKQRVFGEALEEVIGLARGLEGEGTTATESEVVWGDAAIRTEAEITDAAIKKYQAELIDRRQALEDIGYTPQQIETIVAAVEKELADKLEQQALLQAQQVSESLSVPTRQQTPTAE